MSPEIPASSGIRWPERFRPDRATVHVRNQIDVPAPVEVVWPILIRAAEWPKWYPNSANVTIHGGGADLSKDATFRWSTNGRTVDSKVEEFVPPTRVAWSARAGSSEVYHAWLITPTKDGCHVLTEETQFGSLADADRPSIARHLQDAHETWIENLRERSITAWGQDPE